MPLGRKYQIISEPLREVQFTESTGFKFSTFHHATEIFIFGLISLIADFTAPEPTQHICSVYCKQKNLEF